MTYDEEIPGVDLPLRRKEDLMLQKLFSLLHFCLDYASQIPPTPEHAMAIQGYSKQIQNLFQRIQDQIQNLEESQQLYWYRRLEAIQEYVNQQNFLSQSTLEDYS